MKAIIYSLFLLLSSLLSAQENALFEQANSLYNEGKFAAALDRYEAVLEQDKHSAALYFNIANAHYKLNHIAPSIYYYEKAIQLAPKDQDILNNKIYAEKMTVDAIEVLPETSLSKLLNKITSYFNFDQWAKLSVGLILGAVALFLMYYFSFDTSKKRLYFVTSLGSIFLACFTLAMSFHNYNLAQKDHPAIVFAQETQVKSEPNLKSAEAFSLHEGTKVQILDSIKDWRKIQLADGKTGWIQNEAIKAL